MSIKFLITLLFTIPALIQSAPRRSKELTDATFEHDTQATTGSTTGDWFINFCNKDTSKECRNIEPLWQELAGELFGRVSVAHVEVKKNPELQKRFRIDEATPLPRLYFLKRGKFYIYEGDLDLDKLHKFATEGYESASNQGQIPIEASALQKLWTMMLQEIEENGGFLNTLIVRDEAGNINLAALAILFGIPLLTIIGLGFICVKGGSDEPVAEDKKDKKKKKQ